MPTITVHPSSVLESESNYQSVDSSYPFSNVIGKGTDSEVYAQWYMVTGGGVRTKVYYSFDLSTIPSNAAITSVTCQAKCQAQNNQAFYVGNTTIYLFSGTTSMTGTNNKAFGTSATVVTVPETTWTREQLNDCKILIQAARGYLSTSKSYYVRFYGADLTVTYEVPESGPTLYVKENGIYNTYSSVYKKINGVWTLQSNLETLFDTNTNYVKGN